MRRITAEALIELAVHTLRSDIRANVSPDARYALAMTINALEIAGRELMIEPEAAQWNLLDHVYDDGEGSLAQLTKDIAAGTVNDESHPELRRRLERLLVAELEVRNPRALSERADTTAG